MHRPGAEESHSTHGDGGVGAGDGGVGGDDDCGGVGDGEVDTGGGDGDSGDGEGGGIGESVQLSSREGKHEAIDSSEHAASTVKHAAGVLGQLACWPAAAAIAAAERPPPLPPLPPPPPLPLLPSPVGGMTGKSKVRTRLIGVEKAVSVASIASSIFVGVPAQPPLVRSGGGRLCVTS